MIEFSELLPPSRITHSCFLNREQVAVVRGGTILQVYEFSPHLRLLDEIQLQAAVTSLRNFSNKIYITFKTAKMSVLEYANRKFLTESLHYYEKLQHLEHFANSEDIFSNQRVSMDLVNNNYMFWFQPSTAAVLLNYDDDPLQQLVSTEDQLNPLEVKSYLLDVRQVCLNLQLSHVEDLKLLPKYSVPTIAALCWSQPSWEGLAAVEEQGSKALVVVPVKNIGKPVVFARHIPLDIREVVPISGKGPLCLLLGNEKVHLLDETGIVRTIESMENMSSCWATQVNNFAVFGMENGEGLVLDLQTLKWSGSLTFDLTNSEICGTNNEDKILISSKYGAKLLQFEVSSYEQNNDAEDESIDVDENYLTEVYSKNVVDAGIKVSMSEIMDFNSYCFSHVEMISGAIACSTDNGILLGLPEYPLDEESLIKTKLPLSLGKSWLIYNDETKAPILIQNHEGRTQVFDHFTDGNDFYEPEVKILPHLEGAVPVVGAAEYYETELIIVQQDSILKYNKVDWSLMHQIKVKDANFVEFALDYILVEHDKTGFTVFDLNLDVVHKSKAQFASIAGSHAAFISKKLSIYDLHTKKSVTIDSFDYPLNEIVSIQLMVFNKTTYLGVHSGRSYIIYEVYGNELLNVYSPPAFINQSPIYLHNLEALIFPSTSCLVLKSSMNQFRCHKLQLDGAKLLDAFPYLEDSFAWVDNNGQTHTCKLPEHIDGVSAKMPIRFVETEFSVSKMAYHDDTNQLLLAGGSKVWTLNVDSPLSELLCLEDNEQILSMLCMESVKPGPQLLLLGTSLRAPEDEETNGYIRSYKVRSEPKLTEMDKKYVRGPVSALADCMGYLAAAHGPQIHMYDIQSELVPIGFFDGKVHFQDLKTVRNILLFGEKLGPPRLINFCLQPHRLDQLSAAEPDKMLINAIGAVSHGERGDLVVCNCTGDTQIQFCSYDPESALSIGGTKLVPQSLFFTNHECTSTTLSQIDDDIITIGCCSDGTVFKLSPLNESEFRSLYILTQQLMDKEQSIAGVNLKGFRSLLNTNSHSAYVIDGELAQLFWRMLPSKQAEYARKLGVDGLLHLYRALDRRILLDI